MNAMFLCLAVFIGWVSMLLWFSRFLIGLLCCHEYAESCQQRFCLEFCCFTPLQGMLFVFLVMIFILERSN
jgi:hypothetical protein